MLNLGKFAFFGCSKFLHAYRQNDNLYVEKKTEMYICSFFVQRHWYFDSSSTREVHEEAGLPSCPKAESSADMYCFQATRKSEKVSLHV